MPRLDYETHEMWTARTIRELRHFADSLERGDMVLAHEDGHGYIDARHKDDEGDLSVLVTHARSGDAQSRSPEIDAFDKRAIELARAMMATLRRRGPRYIFLDVDGVLNSADWYRSRPSREEWAKLHDISPEPSRFNLVKWCGRSIDSKAVENLNRLVELSGAHIVVSSTWRTMHPLPKLERMLRERGYIGPCLLGTTPDAADMVRPDDRRLRRGDEIRAWLDLHPTIAPGDFVIIDDDADMEPHLDRLVQTDFENGFTSDDVTKAMRLFVDFWA